MIYNKIEHILADQHQHHTQQALTPKDYTSDQEVRWCPGCGDYSILKQVQTVLPELGYRREEVVFVSGIGCSSRFPYYMNTYGMHTIHGRATAVATGLKMARPDLAVWIVTGDGDSLSIGIGHTLHMLRRNPNVNVLLFNNQIYGLTKGQYSPTSEIGKITKSTPAGSLENPFNPLALALGADATFVARSLDRDVKHLQEMIRRADAHKGTSLLEIYQNCNVFNDGAFEILTNKNTKSDTVLVLQHQKPLRFGVNENKGIRLNGLQPEIIDLNTNDFSADDLWIHNENDHAKASLLARFFDTPNLNTDGVLDPQKPTLPRPIGVLYQNNHAIPYEQAISQQIETAKTQKIANLNALIKGRETWTVA